MKDREMNGESNVWSTAKNGKRCMNLMFMLG